MSAALLATLLVPVLLGPPVLPEDDPGARAPSADVALRGSGPVDCRDLAELRARVAEFAPQLRLAAEGEAGRVDAQVELRALAGSWSVTVSLRSPELPLDQRSFEAESCAVAVEAAALVIAVAIDPVAVAEEVDAGPSRAEPEPEPPAEQELPVEPEPPAEPVLRPAPVPDDLGLALPETEGVVMSAPASDPGIAARVGIAALGGGGYGPLSQGAGQLGLGLGLLGERWRAELRGLWFPPVGAAVGSGSVRVDGFSVSARGCGVLRGGPLEFPLCGGLGGGLVRGTAVGLDNASSATQPLLQLELGAGLAWAPVERLAIGVEVEALGQLVAGGFATDGAAVVANIPVGVRGLASVELRLGGR